MVTVLAITLITSCSSEQSESLSGDNLELTGLTEILTENEFQKGLILPDTSLTSSTNQIPKNRDDLNKMRTVVKIFNGKDNAGVSLPGFGGLKLGKEESSLNVYYIETRVLNTATDSVVYGCGYSIQFVPG